MKKVLFTLLVLSASLVATAQEELQPKGFHPWDTVQNHNVAKEYAHWSITPHIGFNYFSGDFNSEMRHGFMAPSVGFGAEYGFTPVIALGLEYRYNLYGVAGNYPRAAKTLLRGHLHNPALYLSVDLMNAMFPRAERKLFNWQLMVGAGMGFYKSTVLYYDDDAHGRNTLGYINANGDAPGTPDKMTKYESVPNLRFGTNFEFNIDRSWALGLRIDFSYFLHDRVDGRGYMGKNSESSKSCDGLVDVLVNLRYKIEAEKKTHVRNIPGLNYSRPSKLLGTEDPIIVHDTVIIIRDTTKVVYRDTTVIYRDTMVIQTQVIEQKEVVTEVVREEAEKFYYIYFDTNKTNIKDDGLLVIQQVSDRMAADTTLYAVIIGYCDNVGSRAQNYKLGDQRAGNVEDELHREHNIDSARMFSCGYGIVEGGRSQGGYSANRRVGIQLVNKDIFDTKVKELKEAKANREF
jgi:outer membrane protein OmpA-like peptidoglycan-associated protein/opacity protein-like surface antigen